MILTEQRVRVLSEICPTMLDGVGGHKLIAVRGPRGGFKHYRIGALTFSMDVVAGLIGGGLIDPAGTITERGVLALQDALADRR